MLRVFTAGGFAALLALAAFSESGADNWSGRVAVGRSPEQTIANWPSPAKALARATIEKYGRPHEATETALVWYGNGPWKKTIVHRRAWPHYALSRDKDYLENAIGCGIANDMVEELTSFDKKLEVDQLSAELSSRSESEEMNFLALNLADEILNGKRTPADARDFYAKTARLAAAGKTSPYLRGLMFEPHNDASPYPWSRK